MRRLASNIKIFTCSITKRRTKGERMPHSSKWSPPKMNTGIDAPTKLFSPNLVRLFSTLRFFNPFLPIRTTFFSFFFRGCGLILGSSSAMATSTSSSWGREAGKASDWVWGGWWVAGDADDLVIVDIHHSPQTPFSLPAILTRLSINRLPHFLRPFLRHPFYIIFIRRRNHAFVDMG